MKTVTESSKNTKNLVPNSRVNLNNKAVKLLADSIFAQLQSEGCAPRDIISVSSQLISLLTDQLQHDGQ